MTASDWIAAIALMIASGALALEVKRWFESGPRLFLSVMADAVMIPNDDGTAKLALTVVNRGDQPTMITHMVCFVYPSIWRKWRRRATTAGIVNSHNIPSELGINKTWMGLLHYNETLTRSRTQGHLYVGIIASHSNRTFLVNVPAKKALVPTETI